MEEKEDYRQLLLDNLNDLARMNEEESSDIQITLYCDGIGTDWVLDYFFYEIKKLYYKLSYCDFCDELEKRYAQLVDYFELMVNADSDDIKAKLKENNEWKHISNCDDFNFEAFFDSWNNKKDLYYIDKEEKAQKYFENVMSYLIYDKSDVKRITREYLYKPLLILCDVEEDLSEWRADFNDLFEEFKEKEIEDLTDSEINKLFRFAEHFIDKVDTLLMMTELEKTIAGSDLTELLKDYRAYLEKIKRTMDQMVN